MNLKSWLLASFMVVGAACGVSEVDVETLDDAETLADDSAELTTTKDTYLIVVRRDYRKCVAPMCGGYWVKDLNSTMQEKYVSGFDFTESNVPEALRGAVTSGADNQVVIYGRLGPKESRFDTRTLLVKLAYRGLPGESFSAADKFFSVFPTKIACIRAPCAYLQTTRLNRTTGHTMSTDVDLSAALQPRVSQDWLLSRVISGKAIVAGNVARTTGGYVTVRANQVFVQLPDRVSPCQTERAPSCSAGRTATYSYTGDRCVLPTGECTPQVFCPAFVPSCSAGYRAVTYSSGCTRVACEPDFLER